MMKLGIDSICIPGYVENVEQDENPYHQWNYVKLDDVWYAVDATRDDPVREVESQMMAIQILWHIAGMQKEKKKLEVETLSFI